jgi:L-lactate dehydrogenase complex protein LldF
VEITSHKFTKQAIAALDDEPLQRALKKIKQGFVINRGDAVKNLPEFDLLRDEAKAIKDHTLAHIDLYLEAFEKKVTEHGGQVHWCRDVSDAQNKVLEICRSVDAQTVTKGKSMIGEEIAINAFLEKNGIEPIETDLGEYIIQLRQEPPSHIIAPAIHVTKDAVADIFLRTHTELDPSRSLEDPRTLVDEARSMLRQKYLDADVGITGANFLVAETGSTVIVTNEGNGDLTQSLPQIHIVLASIEKVVPTLEDTTTILRVLARSATGQEFSAYTTFSTGAKRPSDPDGPAQFHVILLDNGRSDLIGSETQDILRCIRCGACMNHCPVYSAIGGHAYGWVYPGPMGAVLSPSLLGIEAAYELPHASSFCGRCEEVCPRNIPLPKLLRRQRQRAFERRLPGRIGRWGLAGWAFVVRRPKLYHRLLAIALRLNQTLGAGKARFAWFPFAAGWTKYRDLPAPAAKSFLRDWGAGRHAGGSLNGTGRSMGRGNE